MTSYRLVYSDRSFFNKRQCGHNRTGLRHISGKSLRFHSLIYSLVDLELILELRYIIKFSRISIFENSQNVSVEGSVKRSNRFENER